MNRLVISFALAAVSLGCQYPEVVDQDGVCVSIQGASLECTITVDGQLAHIETVFQDGKDPNDGCAGPLETTCVVDVEPGTYTIEYADEQIGFFVPGGQRFCIGGAGNDETGG